MTADRKDLLQFGDYLLDPEDGSLQRGDSAVHLARKAADVLILIVEAGGRIVDKDTLRDEVWKLEAVDASNVGFQIREIRTALGTDRDLIETVRGRGYRLTVPVRRRPRQGASFVLDSGDAATPRAPTPPISTDVVPAEGHRIRIVWAISIIAIVLLIGFNAARTPAPLRIVESIQLTHDGTPFVGSPVLTDGSSVYYRRIPDNRFLYVPALGGESREVFDAPSNFDLADPSPGSQYLVIKNKAEGHEGELWAVPKASGIPHRIGDLIGMDAKWSPDGSRLALVANSQLVLADANGANPITIATPRRGFVAYPRWSPDSSRVRFTVDEPADAMTPAHNIWEVPRDGGEPRLALPDWNPSRGTCCGVWTPDGRYFVFQASRGDRRTDLWALTEPSMLERWLQRPPRITELTAGPLSLSSPAVSRDGGTIFAIGALQQGQLARWDEASRTFVPYLGGISAAWISYSPDRGSIAYVGYPDRKLWRSRIDGSDRRELVGGDFDLDGVAWSPDGKWIAFRSRMAGRRLKIFLVPASGGRPHAITSEDRDQGVAAWSQDGRQLVFGDVPKRFGYPDGNEVLHLYDVATKALSIVPGSEKLWNARWSPDGRYISALTIDLEQRLKLYDTRTQRWHITNAVHVDAPNWSKDSQSVYYDTEGQSIALRRLHVPTNVVHEITPVNVMLAVYGWSGLSADDAPLILKNLTSPAVYALTIERR
jgi:DNA-binding winged helix-turn-helix (wHTH) protein/Tol biopolymer transport system component